MDDFDRKLQQAIDLKPEDFEKKPKKRQQPSGHRKYKPRTVKGKNLGGMVNKRMKKIDKESGF